MARLYSVHAKSLGAAFADLENHALGQERAPLATPGSVLERRNAAGFPFYALQQYDHSGRRTETYLAGPVGDAKADAAAAAERSRIADQRGAIESARLLIREGYAAMDPKPFAVVASLANAGLFGAGGVLVGTHAFEVVVNRMGIRAAAYATEDVDLARPAQLALESVPEGGLLAILRGSGIDFIPIPGFDPREPTAKIKERGRSRFTFDLLMPTAGREPRVQRVPELDTHATALPYLGYLVEASQPSAVLSRIGVAAVRVPLPERFAIHKMLVSQLRVGRSAKSRKDLDQAAVLFAALSEREPRWASDALRALPKSALARVKTSAEAMRGLVQDHAAALEELGALVKA